ncbi:MAG TPA: A/G-specific adenine glycosylase [Terriglobales bacterium]|nr:A/G-specific adenine glycosylase [Terriglobales bacterium]
MTTLFQISARRVPGLQRALLGWYDANRRDLPWRKSCEPYRIWLSEIMLQQTRVAAVLLHYDKFLKRFPTVHKLAAAREPAVLAQWSGLGYYRRARNLHAAAKLIVQQRGGGFPKSAQDLLGLPGIGRYTAAAIASIAFNEPVAVLDGNVERVLRRLFGGAPALAELWDAAESLLDHTRPGDFNQAMMELGALICLPSQPSCSECPIRPYCRTRGAGQKATAKFRQHKRHATYLLARRAQSVRLVQRSGDERLMPGMWELPQVLNPAAPNQRLFSVKHSITITNFTVNVVTGRSGRGNWVQISRLQRLPLTGLARKILRKAAIIQ